MSRSMPMIPILASALPLFAQVPSTEASAPFADQVKALGSEKKAERVAAEAALARTGIRALPALQQALRSGADSVRLAVVRWLPKLGESGRALAPELLQLAAADAGPVIELSKLVQTGPKGLRAESLVALVGLVPYLDQDRRQECAGLLASEIEDRNGFHVEPFRRGIFRSRVAEDAAGLVEQLTDANAYLREAAAERLGFLEDASPAVLNGLQAALEAEDHPTEVKLKLANLSGSSSVHHTTKIRLAAARALVRLAKGGKQSAAAALFLVREEPVGPRLLQALRLVGQLGKEGRDGLPRLLRLVQGEDPRIAAEAVTAVGMIGILTDAVEEALTKAAGRPEKGVAVRAAATLKMLQRSQAKKAP